MNNKNVKIECREWMTRPELIDLATIDGDGFPQVRSLANMRNASLYPALVEFFQEEPPFRVYLTTHGLSEKVRHLKENARVSVYFGCPETFQTLLLLGEVKRVRDKGIKETLWQSDWTQFYPDGPLGPSFAVFVLDPLRAKGWNYDRTYAFDIEPEK